jgi:beta-lactamase class A
MPGRLMALSAGVLVALLAIGAWPALAPGPGQPDRAVARAPVSTHVTAIERGGWGPNVRAARRWARGRAGRVRFAVVGLTGRLRTFQGARTAPMASLFKAMLLAAYLNRARDRDLHGWERDLLNPMIRRSDDVAATRVRDMLGPGPIVRIARRAHMRDFSYHSVWGLSRASPRDQARFFSRWDRYVPERHERYARYLLSNIVSGQRWGIAQARPKGWRIYFKGGWGDGSGRVNHQTAFLERRRCRVTISVMTEFNPNHRYGSQTQRGIAARLLDGVRRAECGRRFGTGNAHVVSR